MPGSSSGFAPVHLPEDRKLDGKASQTLLRHFNLCPRSAYLYQVHKGATKTMEMMRGSAGHAIFERATRAAMEQSEPVIPPEIVKVIVDEVLSDPAFPVPVEEHDYLRESAYRWASETAIDPQSVIACESLFVLEVGGWRVRCKIDLAEMIENGAAVHVSDYKTGRGAPPFEEVARKRPDGTLMAKSFQLVLYALALAYGVPVRVELADVAACLACGGERPDYGATDTCPHCGSDGPASFRREIPEPFPVADRAQRFDLEFVYPGIEDREGKMVRRPVTLTRLELDVYRSSLEALLTRLAHAEETGDWPAVVSDQACDECPAAAQCPIPRELRDHRGEINTPEQAAEALAVRARVTAEQRAIQKELRKFVEANGPVVYGNGMVAEVAYSEHEEVFDKEGMFAAVERATRYGEPFERWRFVRTKGSNRFKERALTVDELAESEGSNGSIEESDDGGGVDRERRLDERFGAEPPY